MLKSGIRILAIEDAPFERGQDEILIVGVVGRNQLIEGILSSHIQVDGDDSTEKIRKMVTLSRFRDQIGIIVLNGITLGGLNLVDIYSLNRVLGLPIIAITRKRPRATLLAAVLKKYGSKKKLMLLKRIREDLRVKKIGGFYIQSLGIDEKSEQKMAGASAKLLRVAHLIASGVATGESKGRI